jgi:putative membrane-bound dehydrogenase-like protein
MRPYSLLVFFLAAASIHLRAQDDPRLDPRRPVAKTAALKPAETAAQMQMLPGFRVELIAGEPQLVQPIAYAIDDRGRLWVVENTNYPDCPGKPKDRVLVFEDTRGDGKFDKCTVFWDKATFTSGIAVGFGGVWLGSPPDLLFIPLADGDDPKPAGEPQVVLDGWGNEDTHETLNDFTWGPDGWLYGTQGVFTFSKVGKPGSPDSERVPLNACVWRFHPQKKIFERWCEGASNQWGIDWNDHGEAFFEACVIPHMWHAMEGAHYQRQGGPHDNPYVYDDIKTIAWGRYEKAAYCGAMVYLGGAFPDEWRDCFFFHDIHMNKMRCEKMVRDGSGYRSERKADFLVSPDAWFRGLSPQYGPDGGVFINDWYDRVPCHQQRAFVDRTNGRIYKVVTDAVKPVRVDLAKASDAELVQMQLNANDWYVRHARRLLQERGAKPETTAAIEKILFENTDDTRQLRALWTLHCQHALSDASALRALSAKSEHVRGWAATCACEDGKPSTPIFEKLVELAKNDPSPLVRRRLASAAQRLPTEGGAPATPHLDRWPLIEALALHAEDANDHNLPLMDWYAAEAAIAADPVRGVALLRTAKIPKLHEFIARRVTAVAIDNATGERKARSLGVAGAPPSVDTAMESVARTLANADTTMRGDILRGMLAALKGQKHLAEPRGWDAAYAKLKTDSDTTVRDDALKLALIFGSQAALDELRSVLADSAKPVEARRAALEALANQRDAASLDPLLQLARDASALRAPALRALAVFDDPRIAPQIVEGYASLDANEKHDALNTLVTRPQNTRALLAAIDAGKVPRHDITAPLARVIQGFKDEDFDAWLEKNWGSLKTSSADKQKEIDRYKRLLTTDAILHADLKHGREVFERTCVVCHTLFGRGGKIGPELPGSFTDIDYLLQNIVDPNAIIGKDYQQVFITTKDGELHAGIIGAEDKNSVTLKTLAEPVTIPRTEIKSIEVSPNSMMPEGLLGTMSEKEVRDLFLYLRQPKEP